MSFIIDVCTIAVMFCFIFVGYKNGLIKSVLSFISTVLSFFISGNLAPLVTSVIYKTFVYNSLYRKINDVVTNAYNNNVKLLPSEITSILPKFIARGLDDYGITDNSIFGVIQSSPQSMVDDLMKMFEPVFISFLRPIVVAVLFMLLYAIFGAVARSVDKLVRLPVLSQVNSFFGATLGFAKFWAILFLVGLILRLVQPFVSDSDFIFSERVLDGTLILSKIYHNSYYEKIFSFISDSLIT